MSDHNLVNNSSGNSNNLPDVAATSGNATSSTSNGDLMSAAAVRDWIETKNKKAALKLEKLDTDLKNYKSNSIKVCTASVRNLNSSGLQTPHCCPDSKQFGIQTVS